MGKLLTETPVQILEVGLANNNLLAFCLEHDFKVYIIRCLSGLLQMRKDRVSLFVLIKVILKAINRILAQVRQPRKVSRRPKERSMGRSRNRNFSPKKVLEVRIPKPECLLLHKLLVNFNEGITVTTPVI